MLLLEGHTGKIADNCLVFSADGRWLLSGSADKTARLWDVARRQVALVCKGHDRQVNGVGFANGAQTLVTGSWDNSVRFWDAHTGKKLKTLKGDTSYNHLTVAADGRTVAAAGSHDENPNEVIELFDGHTFERRGTLGQHGWEIGVLTFSADGNWLASGSADNSARVWDRASGEQVASVRRRAWIQGLAFSPDSQLLAVATGRAVGLHAVPSGQRLHFLNQHNNTVYAAAFTPSGHHLLTAGDDEYVNCWEVATGRLLRAIRWKVGSLHALAVAPDGMTAVAGSADGRIVLWDLDDL